MSRHLSVVPSPAAPTSITGLIDQMTAQVDELQAIYEGLRAAAEAEKLNAEYALSAAELDTSTWYITSEIRCHESRIRRLTAERNAVLGDNPKADRTRDRIQGRIDIEQSYLDELNDELAGLLEQAAETANFNDAA